MFRHFFISFTKCTLFWLDRRFFTFIFDDFSIAWCFEFTEIHKFEIIVVFVWYNELEKNLELFISGNKLIHPHSIKLKWLHTRSINLIAQRSYVLKHYVLVIWSFWCLFQVMLILSNEVIKVMSLCNWTAHIRSFERACWLFLFDQLIKTMLLFG